MCGTDEPKKRILWAAENNKLEEVQQLLVADPTLIRATDKDGYSPLHRAAYSDHLEMTEVCGCGWVGEEMHQCVFCNACIGERRRVCA